MKYNIFSLSIFLLLALQTTAQKSEKDYLKQAPFKMPAVVQPKFPKASVCLTDFGAVGDGQKLNTDAFKNAIDALTTKGGGKLVVPPGLWLTGPIELQSNINLEVQRGALIQFTSDRTQYPIIQMKGSSSFVVASPIYGSKLKNIAITGEGIIDGAGESWRPVKKSKVTAAQWKELQRTGVVSQDGSVWWPSPEAMEGEDYLKGLKGRKDLTAADYLPARDFLRPYMCYLVNCENVLLEGVTIRNSPKFVFYPNNCTNLTMRSVNIFNEWWAQNGDGIDISACKNVVIYKCNVSAGDDGICMKSSGNSKDEGPRLENVVVAGCTVYHGHGGFVIGSNTDGGMNNVFVTDCNFIGTDIGIRVKSNAGRGGLVKNIFVQNIFMSGIEDAAILFDTYYEDVPAGKERSEVRTVLRDKTPEFRDFYISDIYCRGAGTAVSITGLPEMPVHDIHFSNMVICAQKGYEAMNANNIEQKNVKIILSSVSDHTAAAAPWNGISIKPHTSINTSELERQYRIYPRLWDTAFAFLNSRDLGSLAPGKYPLIGDSVFVSVTLGPGKEFENTNWESHRNYIDIQYVAGGKESIGVMPVKSAVVTKPYDATKDATNYSGEGSFFTAEPGVFFIFFPSDAHRPGIKVEEGNVRKVVVKVLAGK